MTLYLINNKMYNIMFHKYKFFQANNLKLIKPKNKWFDSRLISNHKLNSLKQNKNHNQELTSKIILFTKIVNKKKIK